MLGLIVLLVEKWLLQTSLCGKTGHVVNKQNFSSCSELRDFGWILGRVLLFAHAAALFLGVLPCLYQLAAGALGMAVAVACHLLTRLLLVLVSALSRPCTSNRVEYFYIIVRFWSIAYGCPRSPMVAAENNPKPNNTKFQNNIWKTFSRAARGARLRFASPVGRPYP